MVPEKKDRIEISVIVPIYRVEAFLPACIDSILKQTFRNIEVILVDDGSDDGCPAICDAAAEKDVRVQVIHQENQGLSAARNTGIDAAKGEYIAFVDSDDTIEPTMLESMLERIRQDGSEMALCNYRYVDERGKEIKERAGESPIVRDEVICREQAMDMLCIEKSWYYITAWNKLYARRLFEHIRFPVGKRNEDVFVAHEFYWACERISVVKEPLYHYVWREGSIMRSKPTVKMLDAADGWLECCRFALDKKIDKLAVRGYNGAISEISSAWHILNRQDREIRCTLQSYRKKSAAILPTLMRLNGFSSDKMKWMLFALSPRLYERAKQAKRNALRD